MAKGGENKSIRDLDSLYIPNDHYYLDVYWCDKCNQPLLTTRCGVCNREGRQVAASQPPRGDDERVASDIRPVFPEERRLLEILLDLPVGHLSDKSVWDTSSSNLLIDGKALVLNKAELMMISPDAIRDKLNGYMAQLDEDRTFLGLIRSFIQCNQQRLHDIELEALEIIHQAQERYGDYLPIVSFSGGKDSTVISDLVRRGYASQQIVHIFGDTTLELPDTVQYVSSFKRANNKTPVLRSHSRHEFMELCERIGPPTRVMRWCCTVFKTGPIGQTFAGFSKNQSILTYYGIRRSESHRRSNYDAISQSPKVSTQTVVSPIINWNDADIWLYLFAHEIEFNRAYRLGFSRVGCWACPSNSKWSFFLTRIYYPELAEPWRDYLIEVAAGMGKPDPIEYVDSGNWKARQGGQGISSAYKSIITSRPCGDDPDAKTYSLTRPLTDELYEYFKPFGQIDRGRGRSLLSEVFVVDRHTQDPLLLLQGRIGSDELRVKVVTSNNPTLLMQRVDCQIRKYQSCVLCGGCPSACPVGAISDKTGSYSINEHKCVGCLECITHFDTGCLVSKVLQTRKG